MSDSEECGEPLYGPGGFIGHCAMPRYTEHDHSSVLRVRQIDDARCDNPYCPCQEDPNAQP